MKSDWKPISEPPRVPEGEDGVVVLCYWNHPEMSPKVLTYLAVGIWTDMETEIVFRVPAVWTYLPSMEDVFG